MIAFGQQLKIDLGENWRETIGVVGFPLALPAAEAEAVGEPPLARNGGQEEALRMDASQRCDPLARGGDRLDRVGLGREDTQGERASAAPMQTEDGEGIAMRSAHDRFDLALLWTQEALGGGSDHRRHATVSSARTAAGSTSSSADLRGMDSNSCRFSAS